MGLDQNPRLCAVETQVGILLCRRLRFLLTQHICLPDARLAKEIKRVAICTTQYVVSTHARTRFLCSSLLLFHRDELMSLPF